MTHTSASCLVDLLIYLMILESSANSLAAIRCSDADLAQLKQAITLMGTARAQGQAAFSQAGLDFHEVVAKANGHTLLQISAAAVRQSIEQHQKVLSAIRDRDAHLAAHLARSSLFEYYAHLLRAKQRDALAALASFGSPDSV